MPNVECLVMAFFHSLMMARLVWEKKVSSPGSRRSAASLFNGMFFILFLTNKVEDGLPRRATRHRSLSSQLETWSTMASMLTDFFVCKMCFLLNLQHNHCTGHGTHRVVEQGAAEEWDAVFDEVLDEEVPRPSTMLMEARSNTLVFCSNCKLIKNIQSSVVAPFIKSRSFCRR